MDNLYECIARDYELGPILSRAPVSGGFLSHNQVLQTPDSRYFLKQYRFDRIERVLAVHSAKHFFAEAGVPVILPLRTKNGDTFTQAAGRFYALFPFIDGRQIERGTFSDRAIISTAQWQAYIHQVGKQISLPHVRVSKRGGDYQSFVETVKAIMANMPTTARRAFDQLAVETLELKLKLAARNQQALIHLHQHGHPDVVFDHLVHGDYHDANLFFRDDDAVDYIFDWEKTMVGSRGLQLARAIEFICFSNAQNYVAHFSAENYARARLYLQAYHAVYPISRKAFHSAIWVRYLQSITGLWVETEHYLLHNDRVDPFLEAEHHTLTYQAAHLETYTGQLSADILT